MISASILNYLAGDLIRKQRAINKVPQAYLADKLNMSSQQIGKYEKGISTLTIFRMIQVCFYLNIEPEQYINQIISEAKIKETERREKDLQKKTKVVESCTHA